MEITQDGLRFADKAPSGGDVPVAIANYGNLVYVINEGEHSQDLNGARPTITGHFLDNHGKFSPIPNSFRVTGGPEVQVFHIEQDGSLIWVLLGPSLYSGRNCCTVARSS